MSKTAKEIAITQEMKSEWNEILKEFHEYWKSQGEPHPASNAYLKLNRFFFYELGFQKGLDFMAEELLPSVKDGTNTKPKRKLV